MTPLAAEDVPVVILAGGRGMRLREETAEVPKPMVLIGEQPILWHIMKHYRVHGFRRFVIALGYKGEVIKEYFLRYRALLADFTIDLSHPHQAPVFHNDAGREDFEVTLVETGLDSGSLGRLRRVARYLATPYFMYTYADGLGDVDLTTLHAEHVASPHKVTVTGVTPMSRYGVLRVEGRRVLQFSEKPEVAEDRVSGGFFCIDREVLDLLPAGRDEEFFENSVLLDLVAQGQVGLHDHPGFWHSMDTYRDFITLNELWRSGKAPWKTWD